MTCGKSVFSWHLPWDEKDRTRVSKGCRDQGCASAEYPRDLRRRRGIERQDHRTQDPPKIREHLGLWDLAEVLINQSAI